MMARPAYHLQFKQQETHVMEQWNSGIVDGFPSSLRQRVNILESRRGRIVP